MNKGRDYGVNREDEMTEKRPWPNCAIEARDEAANRIASVSLLILSSLNEQDPTASLYRALFLLSEAARYLESVGAKTLPPRKL